MDRNKATQTLRQELDKHGLTDWGIRLSTNESSWVGKCFHFPDKLIMLNAHHVDIHPDAEVIDTILHEVAHALTPGHAHDKVWEAKAKELGCHCRPCIELPQHLIDAIRSGHSIEVEMVDKTIKTVTEEVIKVPKYTVTRLQDKCPDCGKVAKEKSSIEIINIHGDTVKLITLECFHVITRVIPRGTPFDTLITNGWKDEIKNCKHEWKKTKCEKCGEFRLMKFQVESCYFMESALSSNKGVGIFHDMGLGKTIIALAYVAFHPERDATLYVVKSATKFQWGKEIVRILGPKYMAQIIETSRDFLFKGLKSYIISYDLLRRFDRKKLQALGIKTIVLDECQQIKNPDSTRTQEVRKLVADTEIKVIALSGTPWKNRGSEFFPVLNMISPTKFYSYQHYLDTWVDFYFRGEKRKEGGIKNVAKFKQYVHDIVLRREYNEVMDEFPDINRMKLNMQLDDISQTSYDEETSDFVKWYNGFVIDGTEESIDQLQIIAKIARMRHITGLAKIPATVGFCEEFVAETDKSLVIFVHHKDVGILLLDELKKKFEGQDIIVEGLTASLSDEEKFSVGQRFGIKRTILVASTLACGEGIDGLQKGHDSILHERQWNPANEDQATPGRFRRIGQKSSVVNITCVQADDTVDELLDDIVEVKRRGFHSAMNKGEAPVWNQSEIVRELAKTIVRKHQAKNPKTGTKSVTALASLTPKYPLLVESELSQNMGHGLEN